MTATDGEHTCFVIGPIGSRGSETRRDADFLLNGIIREALEKSVWSRIWRADEDARPGMITDALILDLQNADLVIADLSELNPNVFYEIGIRHTMGRPIVHIASVGTNLPFDTTNQRTIFFDKRDWSSIEQARSELRRHAQRSIEPDYQVTNPVIHALNVAEIGRSDDPQAEVLTAINRRLDRIEGHGQANKSAGLAPSNLDQFAKYDERMEWLNNLVIGAQKDWMCLRMFHRVFIRNIPILMIFILFNQQLRMATCRRYHLYLVVTMMTIYLSRIFVAKVVMSPRPVR